MGGMLNVIPGVGGSAPKPERPVDNSYTGKLKQAADKALPDSVKNAATRVDKAFEDGLASATVGWGKYAILAAIFVVPYTIYKTIKYFFPDTCPKCKTILAEGLCPKCQAEQQAQLAALQERIDGLVKQERDLQEKKAREIAA